MRLPSTTTFAPRPSTFRLPSFFATLTLPEPTTDNLLITGDAMHALDSLTKTPEHSAKYLGKVKLAYIDPGHTTVYESARDRH